jgi:serine/threonine-protein kinase PRP4
MATGRLLFKGTSNNDMLRLHMELKGEMPRKLIKKAAFRNDHFDNSFSFMWQKTDPGMFTFVSGADCLQVSGRPYIQSVAVVQATRDLKSELLNNAPAKDIPKLLELHDLLQQMLMLDPAKRIKVNEALKHPFMNHSSPVIGPSGPAANKK